MMIFWEVLLLVLNGIAIITFIPVAILCFLDYIMVDEENKILKKLNIPLNDHQIVLIGIVAIMLFFISQYFLRIFFENGDIIDRIKMILNRE